jgi:hypothetical protein
LFQVKTFLETNGYVVRGSSDGVTAGMDGPGTDRWVTAANAGTRGTVAAAVQSWIILRDASGVDILLTYQGAGVSPTGDDLGRLSFSAGQLFVLAGTPTHQPTATDERVFVANTVSLIGSTASGDRLWNGWVDSTSKLCRFAVIRNQIIVGTTWGVEEVDSAVTAPSTWTPAVWGFSLVSNGTPLPSGTTIGQAKPTVGGSPTIPFCLLGSENWSSNYQGPTDQRPELQNGGGSWPLFPMVIGTNTIGTAGKLGNLYDWWRGRTQGALLGDMYGDAEFIHIVGVMGTSTAPTGIWPWDGVSDLFLV